jgi:hypothetical protein
MVRFFNGFKDNATTGGGIKDCEVEKIITCLFGIEMPHVNDKYVNPH